jgi:hypothetical protein
MLIRDGVGADVGNLVTALIHLKGRLKRKVFEALPCVLSFLADGEEGLLFTEERGSCEDILVEKKG